MSEATEHLRMIEALLFAAEEALDEASLAARLPDGADVPDLIAKLTSHYEGRGVNLMRLGGKWQLRTAPDLRYLLEQHRQEARRLSRAGLETLAIIAYHQPITRAEIEEVRGVGLSKGTLDILMEIGWVRPRGRKQVPGRPITYATTDRFLEHFGMEDLKSLPGLEELKAAGLLDAEPPPLLRPTGAEQADEGQGSLDALEAVPEGESTPAIE